MSARAIVFPEAGRVELRDVALRPLADDEVVVDTYYSSISAGTERMLFGGKLPRIPGLGYPIVPGYEAAGRVVAVGPAAEGVAVGDEVFVGGSHCYTDAAAMFGGQSSRLLKRAAQVVPLHGIPLAQAPILALAATALHGVRRLGDVAGKRVAVFGMGAVGQLAAQFLQAAGATVVAVDRSAERLATAPGHERVDASVAGYEASFGAPVDHAVEATGEPRVIATCASVMNLGGSIVLLSFYDDLNPPFQQLFMKEVTLLVAREWAPQDLFAARDAAASGAVDLAPLSGHVVPVGRYEEAYRTAFEDTSVLKVVLQWA